MVQKMSMKILFTKKEGGVWLPLFIHNISQKDLEETLRKNKSLTKILRGRHKTLLINVGVSSVILPNVIRQKNLEFHSLMFPNGLIFDSTLSYIDKDEGFDNIYYSKRNFGMDATVFEELWKTEGQKAHDTYQLNAMQLRRARLLNQKKLRDEKKRQAKKKK